MIIQYSAKVHSCIWALCAILYAMHYWTRGFYWAYDERGPDGVLLGFGIQPIYIFFYVHIRALKWKFSWQHWKNISARSSVANASPLDWRCGPTYRSKKATMVSLSDGLDCFLGNPMGKNGSFMKHLFAEVNYRDAWLTSRLSEFKGHGCTNFKHHTSFGFPPWGPHSDQSASMWHRRIGKKWYMSLTWRPLPMLAHLMMWHNMTW